MTTDLDVTTHLHPEGRGIALVELTASLLHFFWLPHLWLDLLASAVYLEHINSEATVSDHLPSV